LLAGYTGLISLAHAGFYGIGAYTTAILATQFGCSFWINIPIAMLFSGLIAFIVSLIALRTVEDYFIICTFVFQNMSKSGFGKILTAISENEITLKA